MAGMQSVEEVEQCRESMTGAVGPLTIASTRKSIR